MNICHKPQHPHKDFGCQILGRLLVSNLVVQVAEDFLMEVLVQLPKDDGITLLCAPENFSIDFGHEGPDSLLQFP